MKPFARAAYAAAAVLALAAPAAAQTFAAPKLPQLVQLSADPFTNGGGAEHATELEAHTFAVGSTIVAAFQTGRFPDGGASDIGWATSLDAGRSWKYGFLPGITTVTNPKDPYPRVSDPAVAYDAAHNTWLIASLPVANVGPAVIVSASDDALTWRKPVSVASDPIGSDKNWIVCDNTQTSKYFGHCYVEWDDGNLQIHLNVSTDGGATWGPTKSGGSGAYGLGGQPLVQPNGTVIVPFSDGGANDLDILSKDGGATWSNAYLISAEADHAPVGMRAPSLPTAAIDAAGTVYVAWHDCSFRANCAANDIVFSKSADGVHWSAKSRIPIDPVKSTVDHFTPGIGVAPGTAGKTAKLGLIYNYFPNAACSISTCELHTAFVTSHNGGATWNAAHTLTAGMHLTWLAQAFGYFVGDYVATAFTSDGLAHSVFAFAHAPSGTKLNEAAVTTAAGLAIPTSGVEYSSAFERPYPNAHSDHPRYHYPPKKRLTKRRLERD